VIHSARKLAGRICSGRKSVLSDVSLGDIRQTSLRPPRKALRKVSRQCGFSYGSVHTSTKTLKLHSHPVHVMLEQKETDNEKRLQYCRWFTHFIREEKRIYAKFPAVIQRGSP
jgi:hypothetical protein